MVRGYVSDLENTQTLHMHYNVGTILGAESLHGIGECDYRQESDIQLSVVIYLS